MKNTVSHYKNYLRFPVFLLIFLFCLGNINAQIHPKMKINLKNGKIIEGNKGIIEGQNVSLLIKGVKSTYSLAEVDQVLAKKGMAEKWAVGCCGGCAAATIVGGLMPNPDTEPPGVGTILAGSAIMGIVGGGIGYVVGMLIDKWDPIYTGGSTAFLHKMDFRLGPDNKGGFHFGLSYKF